MTFLANLCLFFALIPHLLISTISVANAQQLSLSQYRTLLRLHRLLEYPPVLAGWSNTTAFCYLPSTPTLSVSCSGNRVTGLTIVGDRHSQFLSPKFSSDSLFITLSRLPSLTTLTLVGLGLWGQLPGKVDLFDALQFLNLSSNHFSGMIPPEISNMTSLQALDLSKNKLNGTVLELKSLHQLRLLDLSFNNLRSRVPVTLFSMPSIQYISLSNNKLIGELPAGVSCSSGLNYVDVSNNFLTGKPTSCISSNSSQLVLLSSGNCLNSGKNETQHPYSYCHLPALAAVLPPANTVSSGSKSNLGLILGIVGGLVAGVLLIGLLVFLVFRKARAKDDKAYSVSKKPTGGLTNVQIDPRSNPADARRMSPAVRVENFGLTPYRVFTLEDLEEATNRFDQSNLIEDSARGQFYKGFLDDDSMIMVRCLKLKQKLSPQSLYQYMELISKLRHRNLVSLLGHCLVNSQDGLNTTTAIFLVSEYVSNGTLRSHLTEWRKRGMLKWPQRVAAVMGVARGVQFLHTITVPGIVGNDLNIENILMDKTLTTKVSNYDLPVLPKKQKNKVICENPFAGMEEKDYGSLEHGEKEDIYQLGLILLEIISGKPTGLESQVRSLVVEFQKSLTDSEENLKELIDSSIHGTFALESIQTAVELAIKCISEDANKRPSIDDVIWNLQYSVQVQDGWANSESLRL